MPKSKKKAAPAAPSATVIAGQNTQSRWRRFTSPLVLTTVSVGVVLTLGVIGATVGNTSLVKGTGVSATSDGQAAAMLAPNNAFNPTATAAVTTATTQLSKEYVYAGSKMLAVEDAAAASAQPDDLVVWRPADGIWYIRDSSNGTTAAGQFGLSNDKPAPADFDGDGQSDFCVFRPQSDNLGVWHIQTSSGAYRTVQWGLGGNTPDTPTPADYDGDGLADVAVWRSSNGTWYILQSATNLLRAAQFGLAGDKPLPADYDGDGLADFALYRGADHTWHIRRSSDNQYEAAGFGGAGDEAVRGDFDGDGRFDLAVKRAAANAFVYRSSATGGTVSIGFSGVQIQGGDVAVAGDYDADGKTDAAVWRPAGGVWYIWQSKTNTLRSDHWGQNGDVPVPAPMKR